MPNTHIQQLEDILTGKGLNSALAFLNQRVPYRFTAIYRLNKDNLELVELVDKLDDPSTAPLARIPFSNSFCEVAVRDGSLVTPDTTLDKKLDGRPYQGIIKSYVGLPLMQATGALFGSLCHYDYDTQLIDDDEFAFLQEAAALIPKSL